MVKRKELPMAKLLLHTCCATCVAFPYLQLKKDLDVCLFFYNPNIYPLEEYERRLSSVKMFAEIYEADLIIAEYDNELFNKRTRGLEEEKEGARRCMACFTLRLEKTKKEAAKMHFDFFATTLSVSPHKNARAINDAGKRLQDDKTSFYEADFKKKNGYRITSSISRNLDFYRQDYCGCKYSLRR
jgi:epoxyqueuosine reductase